MKQFLALLEKSSRSRWVAILLAPLYVLSFFFWVGITLRKWFLRKKHVPTPVITVGNVSFGGTGKTPLILLLLRHIAGPVAYVSRGYKRKDCRDFVGKWPCCTVERCGDEGMLVANRFHDVLISIADDKWRAIQNIQERVNFIVLDDGLQRYDIEKKLEIATVDAQNPDGYGGLFPRGLLREPLSRLREVDYIVLTNVPQGVDRESIRRDYAQRFGRDVFVVQPKIRRFFSLDGKTQQVPPGTCVALFSSIASPHRFRALMEEAGFCVADHFVSSDHVAIEEKALYAYCKGISERFPQAKVIGTEKDFVKMNRESSLPLLFVEMDISVVAGEKEFQGLLKHITER